MPAVVVVDGYSAGAALAPMFVEAGWRPLHLSTDPEPRIQLDLSAYADARSIGPDGSLNDIARRWQGAGVAAVLAGSETGGVAADEMAALLDCPGQSSATSWARTDKTVMGRHAIGQGLPAARQRVVRRTEDAVAFAASVGGAVVLKPARSASNDGVRLCRTRAEIVAAMDIIISRSNFFGRRNESVLAMERLTGPEYVVDCVSHDGSHFVAAVKHCVKEFGADGTPVNRHREMVHENDPVLDRVVTCAVRALDAFGVRHGASHTDVIVTAAGPVMVELGSRLNGSAHEEFEVRTTGASQQRLLVAACVDPEGFANSTRRGRYRLRSPGVIHDLGPVHTDDVAGIDPRGSQWLRTLPSFVAEQVSLHRSHAHGDDPDGPGTSPGSVYLAHASAEQMWSDSATLRSREGELLSWRIPSDA